MISPASFILLYTKRKRRIAPKLSASSILVLIQCIAVSNVNEDNYYVALVKQNNANIHIHAALEQICCALNPLCPKRWLYWIFRKQLQLIHKPLLFIRIQLLEVF